MDKRIAVVKIVVVGNANGGKTSLIKRYCFDTFSRNYKATIGSDFAMKTLNLNDTTMIKLQFWDIAGQERFGTMTSHYYRDALGMYLFQPPLTPLEGALIVFDLTDEASFKAIEKWKDDMERKMKPDPNVPTLIIGNKIDLVKQNSTLMAVSEQQMDEICNQYENVIGWQLTSAREDENINESIKMLLDKIMENTNLDDESDFGTHRLEGEVDQTTPCCS
eukprot:TRINITY_DN566_c0_g1_i1.p1 TRINITY_DN566_c0_g1~~TRINITY_DN566_c0_g1_i1.p1  ORF type:complete len:220 (-),score=29.37 TRINITY_DN566_c0_g1_i1:326-985(-)